jgi:hypothetical protein
MICADFEAWLDAGRPAEARTAALAHAASCASCAAALDADHVLDAMLRQRFASAPDGFTDRVMARLPVRDASPRPAGDPEPVLPLWVRVAQEPLTIASFVLGSVFLAFGNRLWDSGTALVTDTAERIDGTAEAVTGSLPGGLPGPAWLPYFGLLLLSVFLGWLFLRLLAPREGVRAPVR